MSRFLPIFSHKVIGTEITLYFRKPSAAVTALLNDVDPNDVPKSKAAFASCLAALMCSDEQATKFEWSSRDECEHGIDDDHMADLVAAVAEAMQPGEETAKLIASFRSGLAGQAAGAGDSPDGEGVRVPPVDAATG